MRKEIDLYHRANDWMATIANDRASWECGKDPEEAIQKLQVSFPELKGCEIIYRGKDTIHTMRIRA
jgi:hypothetical protein